MAFLDNSGDIILDVTLTDAGRRRMANGNFNIVKFALGDDEIDYRLYDKNHPSGSAYFDLEILQTPVFQAVTAQNAAINYGLLSITNPNLLYMPSIKINQGFNLSLNEHAGIYYVAANSETRDKLNIASALGIDGKKTMTANSTSDTQILYLETGIDTTDLSANSSNRSTYIINNDLLDTNVTVQVDNRFISAVFGLDGGQPFSAGATSDDITVPTGLTRLNAGTPTAGLTNYVNYTVRGINNLLYAPTNSTRTEKSVIAGPRGVGIGLNFATPLNAISTGTRPIEYSRYGKTSVNLFSDGNNYDYIDTMVIVIGNSSTATAQIPIRLIRYSS